MVIYLGRQLPAASSNLPESDDGPDRTVPPALRPAAPLCLVLLRAGFTEPASHLAAGALLPHHFTLTAAANRGGGIFLLHFPEPCGRSVLPTTLSCGARTFLSPPL